MKVPAGRLNEFIRSSFVAAGCSVAEAARIAEHLVEANLVGHDSHGVIRTSTYVRWLKAGQILADRSLQIAFENEVVAVVDGQFGFGQTVGEQAMELASREPAGTAYTWLRCETPGISAELAPGRSWPRGAASSPFTS
jgi:uncharacterized oxidoreductase